MSDALQALEQAQQSHLANIGANLQLLADLGYGHVTLAVHNHEGLHVVADARPSTAMTPFTASRIGQTLTRADEPEGYEALEQERWGGAERARARAGVPYLTLAYPIGQPRPFAVVLRHLTPQVTEAPGRMERAFMEAVEGLLEMLSAGPLLDVRSGQPFATSRRPGDGVIRVGPKGRIRYASPNAVSIMRLAGVEDRVTGLEASTLPGAGFGIAPVLGSSGAIAVEAEVLERVLSYRALALRDGALVLVEDLTETRRREHEIRVKETTIREIHHRVKNNLQTVASLLRIQARRSGSKEARRALADATERVWSMAVVHDLLAGSDNERIDLAAVVAIIVEHVRRGALREDSRLNISASGATGEVDGRTASSLALALVELIHNAIEHAFDPVSAGRVEIQMRRSGDHLELVVRDDGKGLPTGFDPASSGSLGLAIVRALVEDDLGGSFAMYGTGGTVATIRVPARAHRGHDTQGEKRT